MALSREIRLGPKFEANLKGSAGKQDVVSG